MPGMQQMKEMAGPGQRFFGKLITKVDFGKGTMFSVRKARILPGGEVGIMQTTEICYIIESYGMLDKKAAARLDRCLSNF